ncbi:hypothetical protein EUGRSUZ_G01165 [Eucalyptus grandis]|uniref:Uncharacterized protein n=2 Tax=Eucalyptus grandis TaxID=71139 RepID=A0A059BCY5_EUCGR|nr:hypothetical protein EUGRSUZ_G01165 [Eucalyptus grandis]
MTWSYANQQVRDCSPLHSNGPYSKNLARGTGTFMGTYAVKLWVVEKQYYNYNTKTGASTCDYLYYTQMVGPNRSKSVVLGLSVTIVGSMLCATTTLQASMKTSILRKAYKVVSYRSKKKKKVVSLLADCDPLLY